MWHGYLDQPSRTRLRGWLTRNDLRLHHLHSSGHAASPIFSDSPWRMADAWYRFTPTRPSALSICFLALRPTSKENGGTYEPRSPEHPDHPPL